MAATASPTTTPAVPEAAGPAAAMAAGRGGALRLRDLVLVVLLLAAIAAIVGPGLYTVDEGAYTAQARWVDDGGPWLQPYAVSDLGPGPEPAPLALSTVTDDGWAAFAKAPAYVWALVAARQLHPSWGPVALSAAGLVVAAALAARVAQRLAPGSGRVAFWLVAAASPLLFHANVVWAHTLVAAACLAALAGLLAVVDGRRTAASAALVVVALATAVVLRGEAMLLAPAGALVFGLEFARHRRPRTAIAAVAAIVGGAVGHVANVALVGWVLATSVPSRVPAGAGFDLADRAESALNNLLAPGGAGPLSLARVVSVLVLGFVAVKVSCTGPADRVPLAVLLGVAGLTGVIGATGAGSYHGLLPAVPLLVVGVLAAGATGLRGAPRRVLAIAAAYAVLVVLVSEPGGGGLGWGGRYVLVAAVLVAPIAAMGVVELLRRGSLGRWLVVVALLVTVSVQVAGVRRLDQVHAGSRAFAPELAADLAELGWRDALLLTTDLRVGRVAPDVARHLPLLSVRADEVDETLAGITAADVDEPLAVVVRGGEWPTLPAGWRLGPVEALRVLDVATLRRTP